MSPFAFHILCLTRRVILPNITVGSSASSLVTTTTTSAGPCSIGIPSLKYFGAWRFTNLAWSHSPCARYNGTIHPVIPKTFSQHNYPQLLTHIEERYWTSSIAADLSCGRAYRGFAFRLARCFGAGFFQIPHWRAMQCCP